MNESFKNRFLDKSDSYMYMGRQIFIYEGGLKSSLADFKKDLCHISETWHALNSTLPNTNCTAFFQLTPTLDEY